MAGATALDEWRRLLQDHKTQPHYVERRILDEAIRISAAALQHLSLVGARPRYEFFAERGKAQGSRRRGARC